MTGDVNPTMLRIPTGWRPRSLVFEGDALVDWVGGGARWSLTDRTFQRATVNYAYGGFDAAIATPDGEWAVIFTRLATKGVVLRRGEVVREIDRSFYCADAYEYPVAVFTVPDGRVVLAHCPDEYDRLEIEDLEAGTVLTRRPSRTRPDFFYSRLVASPTGRRLLSGGWIWHPLDVVRTFDVASAIDDPAHLDSGGLAVTVGEDCSAAWLDDDRLIVARGPEPDDEGWDDNGLRGGHLGVFLVPEQRFVSTARIGDGLPAGPIMPVDSDRAVVFHKHPRLVSLSTGEVLHAWEELDTGREEGAIIRGRPLRPPLAFDHARFAVASDREIVVVSL